MLARHHWAVLKTSGSPRCLWIFPPWVLNVVAPLALQTLGEHQGMSLQPPQCAHQHRGSPRGQKGKLIGKGNHPRTNLFVSHSFGVFFSSPFLLHKIHSRKRHHLPESFLGEWAGEAALPLLRTDSQILQKPLSSRLALAAAVWCGLTSFIFCVLPLQCKIRGKTIFLHLHFAILGQINSAATRSKRPLQNHGGRWQRKGGIFLLCVWKSNMAWPKCPFCPTHPLPFLSFYFYLGFNCLLNISSNNSLTYCFNQNCHRKIFSLHC